MEEMNRLDERLETELPKEIQQFREWYFKNQNKNQ